MKENIENTEGKYPPKETTLLSVSVVGKNLPLWKKTSSRFVDRLYNTFKKVWKSDIPAQDTVKKDMEELANNIPDNIHARLKKPTLENAEMKANIALKLAETKEREANARLTNLEAEKLEIELEEKRAAQSQKHIEQLIERGELLRVVHNGEELYILKNSE